MPLPFLCFCAYPVLFIAVAVFFHILSLGHLTNNPSPFALFEAAALLKQFSNLFKTNFIPLWLFLVILFSFGYLAQLLVMSLCQQTTVTYYLSLNSFCLVVDTCAELKF